ncbi:hypothetical protein ACIA5C_46470 [Actinoplanes sp. NPDC051343]|uniref:hypothetical protein n=1 Tax=Actinoplanes sp. NPDC051343 TaxID=3363906 RepID=UPI0037B52E37
MEHPQAHRLPLFAGRPPDHDRAIDQLRARGVMLAPRDSRLYRFFHQTFFEYAAARGVVGLGRGPAEQLVGHAVADSHDLFVGEVAAQVVLLAGRDPRLPGSFARDALLTWFNGDAHLQLLALRSYARLSHPAPQVRARAAEILASCDAGTVRHYLRLLPSTRHPSFERLSAELGLLWSRVIGTGGDPGLGFDLLRALARAAPVFPEDTRVFLEEHDCLKWLLERTPAEICRERWFAADQAAAGGGIRRGVPSSCSASSSPSPVTPPTTVSWRRLSISRRLVGSVRWAGPDWTGSRTGAAWIRDKVVE